VPNPVAYAKVASGIVGLLRTSIGGVDADPGEEPDKEASKVIESQGFIRGLDSLLKEMDLANNI